MTDVKSAVSNFVNARPDKENILEEANRLVNGARQEAYSHPIDNFERIAKFWAVILGVEITAEQVGLCMIALKLARLSGNPTHRDSIVDAAGYAATLEMVIEERKRRELFTGKIRAEDIISGGNITSKTIKAGSLLSVGQDGRFNDDRSYSGWNPNESPHP